MIADYPTFIELYIILKEFYYLYTYDFSILVQPQVVISLLSNGVHSTLFFFKWLRCQIIFSYEFLIIMLGMQAHIIRT